MVRYLASVLLLILLQDVSSTGSFLDPFIFDLNNDLSFLRWSFDAPILHELFRWSFEVLICFLRWKFGTAPVPCAACDRTKADLILKITCNAQGNLVAERPSGLIHMKVFHSETDLTPITIENLGWWEVLRFRQSYVYLWRLVRNQVTPLPQSKILIVAWAIYERSKCEGVGNDYDMGTLRENAIQKIEMCPSTFFQIMFLISNMTENERDFC